MTLTSFKTIGTDERFSNTDVAAERMANTVVTAFQHRSLQAYSSLFPSISSFYDMMEKYPAFYGDNLEAAKKDFEMHYTRKILPAMNQSFKSIVAQGNKAGIDWSTIKLVNVDFSPRHGDPSTTAIITFASNGKEYHLQFEKALLMNGEWKVSQYVTLN